MKSSHLDRSHGGRTLGKQPWIRNKAGVFEDLKEGRVAGAGGGVRQEYGVWVFFLSVM